MIRIRQKDSSKISDLKFGEIDKTYFDHVYFFEDQFILFKQFYLLEFKQFQFCSFSIEPEFTSYNPLTQNQTKVNQQSSIFTSKDQRNFNNKNFKMDLFKRIGTQKKKFKVQFFIGRLKFSAHRQGKIYIVIKRGDHKVKTQQRLQMSEECKLNFNKEILQIEATLYFDEKEQKYQEKTGQLIVVLVDDKNDKIQLGKIIFDVSAYANSGQQSVKESKKLQNSPKKLEGRIEFNVFVKYIGQGSQSSADKVSDFFFGKSKDESQKAIKDKTKRSDSKKKAEKQAEQSKKPKSKLAQENQSEQSYGEESILRQKQKEKTKGSSKTQLQQKYKIQQKNISKEQLPNKSHSLSKNLVVPSIKASNNDKAYLTSQNQDQSSKKQFYFDEPYTRTKDTKEKTKKVADTKKYDEEKIIVKAKNKDLRAGYTNSKHKMVENSEEQGSQGNQDIATSEVQPVDVGNMFSKSQAQEFNRNQPLVKSQVTSLKNEPIPVKIIDKTSEKSQIKQSTIKPPSKSKKDEENSKLVRQEHQKSVEKNEKKNREDERRSIDKRNQLKNRQQNGQKVEKGAVKEQKRKDKAQEQDGSQEEFEFGKKMSRNWLQRKEENRHNESDEEYDFRQKIGQNTNISNGTDKNSKVTAKINQKRLKNNGNEDEQKTTQTQNKNSFSNKFKKSIIQELMPPYSQKQKDKYKERSKDRQQIRGQPEISTKKNPFEQYSDEQHHNKHQNKQQQQQVNKYIKPLSSKSNTNVVSRSDSTNSIDGGKIYKSIKPGQISQNDYQKLVEENNSLKQSISSQSFIIKQLQSDLHDSQTSLQELTEQVRYYQSELKVKQQELQSHRIHTNKRLQSHSDDNKSLVQKLQLELKTMEKQKNQLIVENSKLKDKHKKQFAQYQQILEEKQSEYETIQKSLKADIIKIKEDNSTLRSQVQRLSSQGNTKIQENTKLKSQLYQHEKQSAQVKDALSNLKFKICTLLNQALATGQAGAIELLMELNKH